jgi:class 3 adenylate cyclase
MAPRIVCPSPNAEDLRGIVENVRASVARRAAECNALWSEWIQLQVNLAFKDFRRHADSRRLEAELMRLNDQVFAEMRLYADREEETRGRIQKLAEEMERIDGELAGGPAETRPGLPRKTVLQLDMAGYSTVARRIQGTIGTEDVAALNREIAAAQDEALAVLRIPRRLVYVSGGGDGALLAFDLADTAFDFAGKFFEIIGRRNALVQDAALHALYRRYFRMGASTGPVVFRPLGEGLVAAGGVPIIDAVRFESAGRPGELAVDEATFQDLSDDRKARFEADPVRVKGKREEEFVVRRCVFDADAAGEAQAHGLWQPKT